ncbi:MAG: hypothetical protein ACP5RD_05830 [bacterium]
MINTENYNIAEIKNEIEGISSKTRKTKKKSSENEKSNENKKTKLEGKNIKNNDKSEKKVSKSKNLKIDNLILFYLQTKRVLIYSI